MQESILITGADKGIGLDLARTFCRNGWQVIACCRNPDDALALETIKAASKGMLKIKKLDVTDDKQIASLVESLSGTVIDILLNNAGVLGPENQKFGDLLDETSWLETFRVNTIAPFKLARALLDNVAMSQRRVIATITSEMGSINSTSGGYYIYRSTKAAANMIMKNLSADLRGQRATCVALHPGWVRTRMGGMEAPLSTKESAAGLFKTLCSITDRENGSFIDYQGRDIPF